MRSWRLRYYRTAARARSSRWRWQLVSPNHRIVAASSEGFQSLKGAKHNAQITLHGLNSTVRYF